MKRKQKLNSSVKGWRQESRRRKREYRLWQKKHLLSRRGRPAVLMDNPTRVHLAAVLEHLEMLIVEQTPTPQFKALVLHQRHTRVIDGLIEWMNEVAR